jgi:hypothetical protein
MSRLGALPTVTTTFGFLVGGLAVVVLLLYVLTARFGVLRVVDWRVLGYAGALVLAACVAMTREVVGTLRAHVPQSLGVKTSRVASVQWRG